MLFVTLLTVLHLFAHVTHCVDSLRCSVLQIERLESKKMTVHVHMPKARNSNQHITLESVEVRSACPDALYALCTRLTDYTLPHSCVLHCRPAWISMSL